MAAQGMRGGTQVAPGQECPPGTTEVAAGQLPGAVGTAAEHSRLPAAIDAGDRGAQGAEGEVPGHRRARPPGQPHDAGRHQPRDRRDGLAQPEGDAGRRERVGRAPDEHARRHQRLAAQGTLPRAGRHRLPQRRSRLGREGRGAARGRPQGRRDRRRRSRQAVRPAHHQAGRLAPQGGRSGTGSAVGGVRAARRAGVHPHRRAAGVLPAAGLQERAVARAVAVQRTAATTSPAR